MSIVNKYDIFLMISSSNLSNTPVSAESFICQDERNIVQYPFFIN